MIRLLLLVFTLLLCQQVLAETLEPDFKRVAYFASWSVYQGDFQIQNVPAQKLSHIIYAFAKVEKDGNVSLFDSNADVIKPYGPDVPGLNYRGNLARLFELRMRHPHLSIMVSLGGWTGSAWFSSLAADKELRREFAQSARRFVDTYNLDGIDLDWEYPVSGGMTSNTRSPDDAANLLLTLAELRLALDQAPQGTKKRQLSIALSPNLMHISYLDLKKIGQYCDFVNLMAYNYLVGGPRINHQAALFPDINNSVRAILGQGLPAKQLILGLPAFGRSWFLDQEQSGGDAAEYTGHKTPEQKKALFLPGKAASEQLPKGNRGGNAFDVRGMADLLQKGAVIERHDLKTSAFLVHQELAIYISFDDFQSARSKKKWAQALGLGGMMIWELSADRDSILLDAIDRP